MACGFGHFIDRFESHAGVVEGGHEGQITFIGRVHEFAQIAQAIDVFAQRGEFEYAIAIALFHPSVVLEKSDIIGGAFDTGHDAELDAEIAACRPHVVADACTLETGGEIIAELILVGCGEFSTEERGEVLDFNRLHGGASDGLI